MNKISGSILMVAAAISGHGAFIYVAAHPEIHRSDLPKSVAQMVLVAIITSAALGLWGAYLLVKRDTR
jgi:hypothetical protein